MLVEVDQLITPEVSAAVIKYQRFIKDPLRQTHEIYKSVDLLIAVNM